MLNKPLAIGLLMAIWIPGWSLAEAWRSDGLDSGKEKVVLRVEALLGELSPSLRRASGMVSGDLTLVLKDLRLLPKLVIDWESHTALLCDDMGSSRGSIVELFGKDGLESRPLAKSRSGDFLAVEVGKHLGTKERTVERLVVLTHQGDVLYTIEDHKAFVPYDEVGYYSLGSTGLDLICFQPMRDLVIFCGPSGCSEIMIFGKRDYASRVTWYHLSDDGTVFGVIAHEGLSIRSPDGAKPWAVVFDVAGQTELWRRKLGGAIGGRIWISAHGAYTITGSFSLPSQKLFPPGESVIWSKDGNRMKELSYEFQTAAFSENPPRVALATEKQLEIYDLELDTLVSAKPPEGIGSVSYSPDGAILAVGTKSGTIFLMNERGEPWWQQIFTGTKFWAEANLGRAEFSQDGKFLWIWSKETVSIYEIIK